MSGSPDIVEGLEQMVIDDHGEYRDDDSSGLDNDVEFMPSDSEDEAQEPTWTPELGPP